MTLEVSTARNGSTLQVSLSGELDAHTSSIVAEAVNPSLSNADLTMFVFDARDLVFMDSSGISELLRIQRALAERHATFQLDGAGPTVRRVLEITGLVEILGVQ